MLLKTSDAAIAINVTENVIQSWIKKDGLPAEMISGELMINRTDLLEWATERGLKVDPEIFKVNDDENIHMPTLMEAIESGGIHFGVKGNDKETVLRNVVECLNLPDKLDPEFILQVLLTREAMGTTAIGDGIAIPHVRNPIMLRIPKPKIALCFLETPIDFEAFDAKPVNILFTLTSPTVKVHLHLLSRLAFALREKRLRSVLQNQDSKETIMAVFKEIDSSPGRPK
ncbi:PTS sugar transporter subunit IIA [Desulforegula conservatrix]|uniref:PTS sugar transporter subunit IIA n=1 Tax=Desulforegula conservatrix TaxID=153026 RepID=UPI00040F647F|nr:PTS sugar transporter subunit IIA [Desulforegula conservatrix]